MEKYTRSAYGVLMRFRLVFCLFPLLAPLTVVADPEATPVWIYCDRGPNYTKGSAFERGLNVVLNSLEQRVSQTGYNTTSYRPTNISIYGLAQCRGDVSNSDCKTCISAASQLILQKCNNVSASVIMDGCFLRYETYNFYSQLDRGRIVTLCNTQNSTDPNRFNQSVASVLTDVASKAISNSNRFSVESVPGPSPATIYSLAQCFSDLTVEGCRECFSRAKENIFLCQSGALGGQVPNQNCILRYETYRFFNWSVLSPPPTTTVFLPGRSHSKSKLPIILGTIGGAALVLLVLLGIFLWRRRAMSGQNQKRNPENEALLDSKLNFNYETLKTATDNFNPENKLGQGGFGAVYKGVRPDNRCIAVKRLFFNARQGVNEFFNEVHLISQVKHKNLVILLGCSVDGPERLLVYEYLPNKSLDQFLFDPSKSMALDWRKRFDIIVGTARGLAYLHQESEIRIIHRDIKASNILLDENLKPKIADFGLARFFAEDQSHLSTGVAGTLGYMAPEYVMHGQLTEKVDIFSFGVLVLEIVSGRKNNMGVSAEDMLPLLDTTWKHYEMGTISEIFNREFNQQKEEVCRVVQIALLCTQASPQLRPTMLEIVGMLTSKDSTLPLPTQPAFIDVTNSELVRDVFKVTNENLNSSTALSINDLTGSVIEPR